MPDIHARLSQVQDHAPASLVVMAGAPASLIVTAGADLSHLVLE